MEMDALEIASPCNADWNAMEGTEAVRHCADCSMSVYNVSEMTAAEAEALIEANEGRLCIRLYKRADGTVITRDCPVGAGRRRRRALIFGSLAAGLMAFAAGVGALFFRSSKQCTSAYTPTSSVSNTGTRIGDVEPFKTVNHYFPGTFPQTQQQVLMGEMVALPQTTPRSNPTPTSGSSNTP